MTLELTKEIHLPSAITKDLDSDQLFTKFDKISHQEIVYDHRTDLRILILTLTPLRFADG